MTVSVVVPRLVRVRRALRWGERDRTGLVVGEHTMRHSLQWGGRVQRLLCTCGVEVVRPVDGGITHDHADMLWRVHVDAQIPAIRWRAA